MSLSLGRCLWRSQVRTLAVSSASRESTSRYFKKRMPLPEDFDDDGPPPKENQPMSEETAEPPEAAQQEEKEWQPDGGWAIHRKAARVIRQNARLTEDQEETIRQLHNIDPKLWTRTRIASAYNVPALLVSEIINPSQRESSPYLKQVRTQGNILRAAEYSLQETPWSTQGAAVAGVRYGLRGKALQEFINQKLSLDWGIPRHQMKEWTRRAQQIGLKGGDASDHVQQLIVAYQKRRVHLEQAPHRPMDSDEEYDDPYREPVAGVKAATDFELELESKLRALKGELKRGRRSMKSSGDNHSSFNNMPSLAALEDQGHDATGVEDLDEVEDRVEELEAPHPNEMLWQMTTHTEDDDDDNHFVNWRPRP